MALCLKTEWRQNSKHTPRPPPCSLDLSEDEDSAREWLGETAREAETPAEWASPRPASRCSPTRRLDAGTSADASASARATLLPPQAPVPGSAQTGAKMAETRASPDLDGEAAGHQGGKEVQKDVAPSSHMADFKRAMKKMYNGLTSLLGLLLLLCAYSFLGAFIFWKIEGDHEASQTPNVHNVTRNRNSLIDLLANASSEMAAGILNESAWRQRVSEYIRVHEAEVLEAGWGGYSQEPPSWTFWGALFYCGTIFTTIGYGNIVPHTPLGKVLTMIYATVGVPLALLTLADLGKRFTMALKFLWAFVRRYYYTGYCSKVRRHSNHYDLQDPEHGGKQDVPNGDEVRPGVRVFYGYEVSEEFNLPISVASVICFIYILLGAMMYSLWEEWSYLDAFYFVFISMSTIGFGDITPAHPKFFLLSFIYIFFGLSLVSMCINVTIEVFTKTLDKAKEQIDKVTDKAKVQIGELDKTIQRAKEKIHKRGSQEEFDKASRESLSRKESESASYKGSKEKLCEKDGSRLQRGCSKDRDVTSLVAVQEDEAAPSASSPKGKVTETEVSSG